MMNLGRPSGKAAVNAVPRMKHFVRLCLILAMTWGGSGYHRAYAQETPPAPPLPISLADAMAMAVDRNPAMTSAEVDILLKELALDRAKLERISATVDVGVGDTGGLLWVAGADYSESGMQSLFNNSLQYGLTSTLALPLWDGYSRASQIKKAAIDVDIQKFATQEVRRNLVRAVYVAYWTIQGYALQVSAAREALTQSRQALAVIESRLANGLSAPLELNRFQVDVLSQEQRLADLELERYNQQQTLQKLLYLRSDEIILTDTADAMATATPLEEIDELLERAIAHRPELQSLERTVAAAEQTQTIARATTKPQVNLTLSGALGRESYWDYDSFDSDALAPALSLSTGLSVTWNLFNHGNTDYQLRSIDLEIQKLRASYQSQQRSIDSEVKMAYMKLKTLRQRAPGVRKQLELAKENQEIIQTLYGQGSGSLLDLFDAQTAYRNALSQEAVDRINLVLAEYELRWVMGESFDGSN